MASSEQDIHPPVDVNHGRAARFYWRVTARPRVVVAVGLLAVAAAGAWAPWLKRDASTEAFIPPDDPALHYRRQVQKVFGLSDPLIVLVVNDGPNGVFNPQSLGLVDWLTRRILDLAGVNPRRVTSLATQKDIVGTSDGIEIKPFFTDVPSTQAQADHVRQRVMDFDLVVGNLVSADGAATLIVAELSDDADGEGVYRQVLALVHEAPIHDEQVHVAGEGAVTAHLGAYIDADMRRLNLLCGLVITVVLLLSYRTVRGVLLPMMVVAGAVAVTLGLMAATGQPFYVITNALPVIVIALGVADTVHILGQYYEDAAAQPQLTQRQLVVSTMTQMWRPVTLTSVTDMAGFMGIYVASAMPPVRAFGLYATVGAAAAWLLSLFVVPACLTMLPRRLSRAFVVADERAPRRVDAFGRLMARVGRLVLRRPAVVMIVAVAVVVAGVVGIARVQVNEQRISNFKPAEPIYQADAAMNRRMNGTNYLDVVVSTPTPEGLFDPKRMRRIEALQQYLASLPHVGGAVSIVDYLKQLNRAVNENRRDAYRLPDDEALIAQYFLLYSASGDTADLAHLVDYDYRLANIRVAMNSGLYSDEKLVVDRAQRYIGEQFNVLGMTAHLAGRVNVDVHWIRRLARGHFRSVVLALVGVWLTLAISYRSAAAGLLALTPVAMAVLLIYAVMGLGGIWLSVGTAMFAAIAIGTGVDFAVHTVDRLIVLVKDQGQPLEQAMDAMFPSTGRALLFSFSAVLLGFGLLLSSHVPPLIRFGTLITVCVAASFAASLMVLPVLVKLWRPGFLGLRRPRGSGAGAAKMAAPLLVLLCWLGGQRAPAADEPQPLTGDEIAARVNARDDGKAVARKLTMELIDPSGKKRTRVTRAFRKYFKDDKRTAIFYLEPANVRGTAFLTIDYKQPARDDDRWLYLPAARKVRRISAADRGDDFLGTDFTYEDISNETKVNVKDYTRKYVGVEEIEGRRCLVMEAVPLNEKIAKELGYSRVRSWIDPQMWMLRRADYWDLHDRPLKTIHFTDIRQVQGIWTAHKLEAVNHQNGHHTVLTSQDVDYQTPVDDDLFTVRALQRGL